MSQSKKPEVWLRGPIKDIPALLQPAAHALLQTREEVHLYTLDFPQELLWVKPAGRATVGFHLQHLTGVLDRMLSYAKAQELSETQFELLRQEADPQTKKSIEELVKDFDLKVDEALEYFKTIEESILTETRAVGRKKLPSTVIGLLFHAAEHSQRHLGQMLVTISVLKANRDLYKE